MFLFTRRKLVTSQQYKESVMKVAILILSILSLVLWTGVTVQKSVQFGIGCSGRMKRAANANSIEIAKAEMQAVVKYLEDNKITSGYTTAFLWRTPAQDVGFFYQNMKESLKELEQVNPDATPLERSNVLMKLRETLLDDGRGAPTATCPSGIALFPYNKEYTLWGLMSLFATVFGIATIITPIIWPE